MLDKLRLPTSAQMSTFKKVLLGIVAVLVIAGLILWLLARPDVADLTLAETTGPRPVLAEQKPERIPSVDSQAQPGLR